MSRPFSGLKDGIQSTKGKNIMCLQCCVDAKEVIRFILPAKRTAQHSIDNEGWHLYVATKEDSLYKDEWPLGWYGLLRINDPEFVFPLDLDNPDWDTIHDNFFCTPEVGHSFYEACVRAGYMKDPSNFVHVETWFIRMVIEKLKIYYKV